ncbi:hypothetical protein A2Y83_01785 [Candidatus Falkowbacteria bacterium RBG_13_39_14]|uniref:Uncharacterized protein n=1 Tax=Candidatus Falkowbacteria bacterium RBG_13_39_14 TaxID=1797985 RepID=A0A1F5S5B9_9BACT|nr:MAG: hypothetical protein A2Y83_01785 [Candidatus Falkowbacteria bacterium RBG_13_39_14]
MPNSKKFKMFKCPNCKTAQDVRYDSKGGYCDEDIYHCSKCNEYFLVSAICDKCGSPHSRLYGCNNKECDCMDYHYNREEEEIERDI